MSTRIILALCVLLAGTGWFALAYFTYSNPPDALNRWVGLALLWPTLMMTFLSPVYVVHARRTPEGGVVLRAARQSALIALFVTLCLWLRIIQALNWINALLMAILFLLTEVLLSAREN